METHIIEEKAQAHLKQRSGGGLTPRGDPV